MENREASIGICGAIVGILIGAGSVTYGHQLTSAMKSSPLHAATLGYRNIDLDEAYKRRAQREVDAPVVAEENVEELHNAAPMGEQERNACTVKVHISEELRDIVLALIPNRPIDMLVRNSLNQAFDAYTSDCQSVRDELHNQQLHEAAPVAEPEVEHIPNYDHCEGYSGVRLTRCIDDERKGNPWYRGGAVR